MNTNKVTAVSLVVLALVAGAGFVAAANGAFGNSAAQQAVANNDYAAWKTALQSDFTQERFDALRAHYEDTQAVTNALTNNDFSAWKAAMKDMQNARIDATTQEQFDAMVQAYQSGKTKGFGFGRGGMMGGFGHRMHGDWGFGREAAESSN